MLALFLAPASQTSPATIRTKAYDTQSGSKLPHSKTGAERLAPAARPWQNDGSDADAPEEENARMNRRQFIQSLAAAGLLAACEYPKLSKDEKMTTELKPDRPLPRNRYGTTDEKLSIIGFGGIVVMNATPEEAANRVARAFDRGVNYFDVAPSYGNAQEKLGPALAPYRSRCFLACKTEKRDAAGAAEHLENSLKLLQTDHFDLYQLHAITTQEDIDQAFGPGGAMETFVKAREAGKVRFLGFSAHSELAAHAAMDRFKFDSILFPFNFATWLKGGFGPSVHKRATENKMGILALKGAAWRKWPEGTPSDHPWGKCWYEPLTATDKMRLALRFTLNLPVTAAVPPGEEELFWRVLDIVQSGPMKPLEESELAMLREAAAPIDPLFEHTHA